MWDGTCMPSIKDIWWQTICPVYSTMWWECISLQEQPTQPLPSTSTFSFPPPFHPPFLSPFLPPYIPPILPHSLFSLSLSPSLPLTLFPSLPSFLPSSYSLLSILLYFFCNNDLMACEYCVISATWVYQLGVGWNMHAQHKGYLMADNLPSVQYVVG